MIAGVACSLSEPIAQIWGCGLEDQASVPGRAWNRVPDAVHGQIIEPALDYSELSPRELAVRFTD